MRAEDWTQARRLVALYKILQRLLIMEQDLQKKFNIFLKFNRFIDAENLFSQVFQKKENVELALFYIINFLIPRRRYSDAAILLLKCKNLPTDFHQLEKIKQLDSQIKSFLEKKKQSQNENNEMFDEFKTYVLNFTIIKNKKELNKNYITIDSYGDAKNLCHNQNINEPYESWNDYRSAQARIVYSHGFENNIIFDDYESSTMMNVHEHLESVIFGENTIFFDDVFGDFIEIGRGIFSNKITDGHKLMFDAYKSGYFPCGKFIDGRIIALSWRNE
jgi:hypothetical protein